MAFTVLLTEDAAKDLSDLYTYISKYVLDQIEKKLASLSELPKRGVCPKELFYLGMSDYRELFFKPYRIIYRIDNESVYIYCIVDGRRAMQTLLQRRLLEPL